MLIEIYKLYFAALRAGHAGQGLDIHGMDYLMDDIVKTGDGALLEERVLAVHRLKTAVPAEVLARMGALVGGGTPEQVDAIGAYFGAVGLAFQIMDDVLNLRGLYTDEADLKKKVMLKTLGEDITAGKVTIPVAKAMGILDEKDRVALWKDISSKPDDPEMVADIITRLEDCGAIQMCADEAEKIVEDAWAIMDEITDDSFAKCMLRSFGAFVCYRHT